MQCYVDLDILLWLWALLRCVYSAFNGWDNRDESEKEEDVKLLVKSADSNAEKAESEGKLYLISKANRVRKAAKQKNKNLEALEETLAETIKELNETLEMFITHQALVTPWGCFHLFSSIVNYPLWCPFTCQASFLPWRCFHQQKMRWSKFVLQKFLIEKRWTWKSVKLTLKVFEKYLKFDQENGAWTTSQLPTYLSLLVWIYFYLFKGINLHLKYNNENIT